MPCVYLCLIKQPFVYLCLSKNPLFKLCPLCLSLSYQFFCSFLFGASGNASLSIALCAGFRCALLRSSAEGTGGLWGDKGDKSDKLYLLPWRLWACSIVSFTSSNSYHVFEYQLFIYILIFLSFSFFLLYGARARTHTHSHSNRYNLSLLSPLSPRDCPPQDYKVMVENNELNTALKAATGVQNAPKNREYQTQREKKVASAPVGEKFQNTQKIENIPNSPSYPASVAATPAANENEE